MKISEIKKRVLPFLTPTRHEIDEINKIIKTLTQELEKQARKLGIKFIKIEAQGSTGIKQTNLAGSSDIDIFILLNPKDYPNIFKLKKKEKKKYITDLFRDYSKRWFMISAKQSNCTEIILSYAEHPYISAQAGKYSIDIIGCFYLPPEVLQETGPITAVDRTIHHSNFINQNLLQNQKQEVRLLKAFFKCAKIYGDKSLVDKMGFTGFACELLIHYYENIESVFKTFKNSDQIIIDFFKRDIALLKNNQKFLNQPIIIIDPTDPERNVTASINLKIFLYSKYWIKKFLDKPATDYFIDNPIKIKTNEELVPFIDNAVFIEFKIINQDIHYTLIRDKLYVLAEKIKKRFSVPEYEDIKDFFYSIFYNKSIASIIFYFKKGRCFEEKYLKRGPPLHLKQSIEQFKEKNPEVFENNGRIWAPLKRKHHNAIDFIKANLKDEEFKYYELTNIEKIPKSTISKVNFSFLVENLIPFYHEYLNSN
ncbi:MAG: hypothetical protein ACTSX4_07050 [Candidatus Helarchaeota archaeon]